MLRVTTVENAVIHACVRASVVALYAPRAAGTEDTAKTALTLARGLQSQVSAWVLACSLALP